MELYQTAKGPTWWVGGGTQGKEITKIHQPKKKGGGDSFLFLAGKPLGYGNFFGFLSSFLRFFGKKKWTRIHVLKSKAEQKAEQKKQEHF